MSMARKRGSSSKKSSGLARGVPFLQVCDPREIAVDKGFPAAELLKRKAVAAVDVEDGDSGSCSSSIGRNSDYSGGSDGEDVGEPEVQSALKGPLDTMDELGDSLPIRQGISKFYCGKSKSFTSLADVSSSSCAKNLAKPENSYARKRKNLLSFSNNWDRHQSTHSTGNLGGSLPKRLANSNRRTFPLAGGTSSSESNNTEDHDLSQLQLTPHPNGKASGDPCGTPLQQSCSLSMRSFSLTDLQGATASIASWRSTRDSSN